MNRSFSVPLLLLDPVRDATVRLFTAWMDVRGARKPFFEPASEMLSHPDARVRAAAMRSLVRFEPEAAIEELTQAFLKGGSVEERKSFLEALISAVTDRDPSAGFDLFLPLVDQWLGRSAGSELDKDDPDLVIGLELRSWMEKWGSDLVARQLAAGVPPRIGRLLLTSGGPGEMELMERAMQDPRLAPYRSRAVATSSRYETSDRVAQATRALVRQRGDEEAMTGALIAACNLCIEAHRSGAQP